MIIIMLGAPGTGKGTVGNLLSREFNIPHISSGEIFRSYIKKKNEGKHIAINVGANVAIGKLFFIVNSDDALISNAIELIIKNEK